MNLAKKLLASFASSQQFLYLNVLHILNDGFESSFLLLLPFIAQTLNLSLTQVGAIGTIESLIGVAFTIPSAYIATRFGGLQTLMVALLLSSIGFILAGLSGSFALVIIAFLIGGIGYGVFHPISLALIARSSAKDIIGKEMGNFTAVGDIGRVGIAALLTFVVASIGWQNSSFLYASIACAIFFLFYFKGIFSMRFSLQEDNKKQELRLFEVIKNKRLLYAISVSGADTFASQTLFIFLPFLLLGHGINIALLGIFMAAYFFGSVIGKIILGRAADRYKNAEVFIVSELCMVLIIIIIASTTQPIITFISALLLGLFTKGTVAVNQTMISESVAHHGNYEKTYGISSFTDGIAVTLAPIFLGIIADSFGIVAAFNTMAAMAFLAIIPAYLFKISKPLA